MPNLNDIRQIINMYICDQYSRLRQWILGPHAEAILYSTKEGKFLLDAQDVTIGRELGFRGEYAREELQVWADRLDPNMEVLVIGAHVGTLLVPLSKRVDKIVGYEANPETYDLLLTNLELNDVDNSRVENYAIGDEQRTVEFLKNRSNSGGSKIQPVFDKYIYRYDDPDTISVEMSALDEIEQDPTFDAVIMDIEGSEYFALKGMHGVLEQCRYLQIEYVPHHLENVADVDNEVFLNEFTDYFQTAHVISSGRTYKKPEFQQLFNRLRSEGIREDILFQKEN